MVCGCWLTASLTTMETSALLLLVAGMFLLAVSLPLSAALCASAAVLLWRPYVGVLMVGAVSWAWVLEVLL